MYFFHLPFVVHPATPFYKSMVLVFWGAYTHRYNIWGALWSPTHTMECMNPRLRTLLYSTTLLLTLLIYFQLSTCFPLTPTTPNFGPTSCPSFSQLLSLDLRICCSFCLYSFSLRSPWFIPSRSLLRCHLLRKTFPLPSPTPLIYFFLYSTSHLLICYTFYIFMSS